MCLLLKVIGTDEDVSISNSVLFDAARLDTSPEKHSEDKLKFCILVSCATTALFVLGFCHYREQAVVSSVQKQHMGSGIWTGLVLMQVSCFCRSAQVVVLSISCVQAVVLLKEEIMQLKQSDVCPSCLFSTPGVLFVCSCFVCPPPLGQA